MEKTAIQSFIEDAIAGGYGAIVFPDNQVVGLAHVAVNNSVEMQSYIRSMLLDLLAWQAVGKTRGWDIEQDIVGDHMTREYWPWVAFSWGWQWHSFIDCLADAKTIEEALTATA